MVFSFTHEVASTLNEFLYSYYKISNAADDGEKLYYVENLLYTFDNNFFTQMVFAEFEDYFYGVVESGSALDAEALSRAVLMPGWLMLSVTIPSKS